MNAAELLLEGGQDRSIALECGDRQISYGELRRTVSRSAGAWRHLGLKTGDRAVIFASDSIAWAQAYLGVIWAGGVPVGANPRMPLADLGPIVADCDARFIWCDPDAAPQLVDLSSKLLNRPGVLTMARVDGCRDWNACTADASEISVCERQEDDPAFMIGTSGTTGTPKGIVHAQRAALDCHAFAREILKLTDSDRLYATSKLFFGYALANSFFAGLRLGATVILDPEWPSPERVKYMVARHRPTVLFTVPTLYHKMLQTDVPAFLRLSSVKHYVSAGEALPANVRARWRDATGRAPVSGYGTSETFCLMLYSDEDSGTLWPTPKTQVKDREDSNADLDPARPRRIWVRHSAVALGYWKRPEAQADGFRDAWFSPGDMFLRHPDGGFEFTGRNDDMLKVSGQWVSTQWIEQELLDACDTSVRQIAAVGVSTADGLTAIAVFAVPTDAHRDEAQSRLDRGVAALPKHRKPRWIHWVDSLPLTATGKLQRAKLRGLHEEALVRNSP